MVGVLAQKAASRGAGRAAVKPLKELGEHPENGGPVNVMAGRYGPYVKWEKVNATIPEDTDPETVTMDMAVTLIAAKAATANAVKIDEIGTPPKINITANKGSPLASSERMKNNRPSNEPSTIWRLDNGVVRRMSKVSPDCSSLIAPAMNSGAIRQINATCP